MNRTGWALLSAAMGANAAQWAFLGHWAAATVCGLACVGIILGAREEPTEGGVER